MARKEKKYHFIYKTTNLLNGKYYYGMHSTDNLDDGYYGSGRRLKRSLNKYGKENHKVEILEYLPDRKSLINREIEIVNLNEIAKDDCMNLKIGGTGGLPTNIDLNEFHRLGGKASGKINADKIKNDPNFAKMHNDRFQQEIKKARLTKKCYYDWTGKKHSSDEIVKMSKKASLRWGEKNSQYGTCWITNGNENKKINKNDLKLYVNDWVLGRTVKK